MPWPWFQLDGTLPEQRRLSICDTVDAQLLVHRVQSHRIKITRILGRQDYSRFSLASR